MIVSRMKSTTIRELKHATSKVLSLVEAGESVEVRRRNQLVAVLSPPARKVVSPRPDFAARLRDIYGPVTLETTGTDLVNELRGER
jgi:antitoxin (DNA-binding transcriptional repressor) of toxin-antitoxin stability system